MVLVTAIIMYMNSSSGLLDKIVISTILVAFSLYGIGMVKNVFASDSSVESEQSLQVDKAQSLSPSTEQAQPQTDQPATTQNETIQPTTESSKQKQSSNELEDEDDD